MNNAKSFNWNTLSAVENFGTKELSTFLSLMLWRMNLMNFNLTKAQKDNIIKHLSVRCSSDVSFHSQGST